MKRFAAVLILALVEAGVAGGAFAADAARRNFAVEDLSQVRAVFDPALSPDGEWVAYTVRTTDVSKDRRVQHIWMTSWDGKQSMQVTQSSDSEHSPGFSPDGASLSFLSGRGEKDGPDAFWLLDRHGGDARQITRFKGDVLDYDWSPDGTKIVLVALDDPPPAGDSTAEDRTPPPIVIDRYYFKEDQTGYLDSRHTHLYLLDVASGEIQALTEGHFSEAYPSWSPDGTQIAFLSKRGADPDRDNMNGIYVMSARPGAAARLVTPFVGDSGDSGWMTSPAWSPNGREIAFIAGSDHKLLYYAQPQLNVVAAAGGTPRVVSQALDRDVFQPEWSGDGKSIYALVADDRNEHLVRFDAASGRAQRLTDGRRETSAFDVGPKGRTVVIDGLPNAIEEVYALERGKERPLSKQNDSWLSGIEQGTLEEITVSSRDGTRINGFILKPPGYREGVRYPTVLQIHGGPVEQFTNSFDLSWQILAAQGFVVVAANPRGSSGRGQAFAREIFAAWGEKDTEDVLAVVDYAVQQGIADPSRLGVGGWSYGAILTDNVISRDKRFKAAVSGAGMGNALAGYGTDMYVREYELELGVPWKNLDVYVRNSYPFLHADRIVTPTLFMCGERDFNVPVLNSEQMYEALRSIGVDTQLVIYPDQFHGLSVPSYLRDRLRRQIDWYRRHLAVPPKPTRVSPVRPAEVLEVARPPSS
ncbi:MAG: S9 family peptidase [Gammaproteobacteria bacterium]